MFDAMIVELLAEQQPTINKQTELLSKLLSKLPQRAVQTWYSRYVNHWNIIAKLFGKA